MIFRFLLFTSLIIFSTSALFSTMPMFSCPRKESIPGLPVAKVAPKPHMSWASFLTAGSVDHCQRLGGLALRIGEQFPETYGVGVYGDIPAFQIWRSAEMRCNYPESCLPVTNPVSRLNEALSYATTFLYMCLNFICLLIILRFSIHIKTGTGVE